MDHVKCDHTGRMLKWWEMVWVSLGLVGALLKYIQLDDVLLIFYSIVSFSSYYKVPTSSQTTVEGDSKQAVQAIFNRDMQDLC